MASDERNVTCHSLLATYVLVFAVMWYSIGTEIPLTQTLSHNHRGNFPSLDFVVSSVERWEGLREGDIFLWEQVLSSFLQPPSSPFGKGDLVAAMLRYDILCNSVNLRGIL